MFTYIKSLVEKIKSSEKGQGMVEYALIIGLIAVAAVVILIVLGPKITKMFEKTNEAINED